jgi:acetyl esterase/lipase
MGYGAWTPEANRFGWSSLLGVPAGSDEVPAGAVPAREDNLAGLPPAFIVVGSVDLFADEDIEYAQRLVAAGVPTELHVLPGGYHGFQAASPDTSLARRFNAAIDAALARAFAEPAQAQRKDDSGAP